MRFVDTNVLLHAVCKSRLEAKKRRRALELLREHDLAFSVQVFQEFYYQATRPTRPERLNHDDALAFPRENVTVPFSSLWKWAGEGRFPSLWWH